MVDVGGGMRMEGDAIYGIDDIMYFTLVVRDIGDRVSWLARDQIDERG